MFVYHAAHLALDGINQIFILRRVRINKFNNKKSTNIHSQRMMCMTTVCLCIENLRAKREIGWVDTEKDFKFIAILIGVWSASFPKKDVLRDTEMRFVLLDAIHQWNTRIDRWISTNFSLCGFYEYFSTFRTFDRLQLTWPLAHSHVLSRRIFHKYFSRIFREISELCVFVCAFHLNKIARKGKKQNALLFHRIRSIIFPNYRPSRSSVTLLTTLAKFGELNDFNVFSIHTRKL